MFSIPSTAKAWVALGSLACAACAGGSVRPEIVEAPPSFYTLTAEIALSRHEPRVAALQYAAAAARAERDPGLLRRATEVSAQCLQPSLTTMLAARWLEADAAALDAHRAAGAAALELQRIDEAALHYQAVLRGSPRGTESEFAALETELAATDNVHGARQLADRLATYFPTSGGAARLKSFTALRADDPAAAVKSFEAALAAYGPTEDAERRNLVQGLRRARVLAGDVQTAVSQARELAARDDTPQNRLDYAIVLLAAQDDSAARTELGALAMTAQTRAVALRLLGLLDFQDGRLEQAGEQFALLLTTGEFLDDAFYYLGQIAERHQDWERALELYAQVQGGDNAVPALLRAATLLKAHGAGSAAEDLLDQLVVEEPARAPEILAARARLDADAGDVPAAIAVLQRAQLDYPDSVDLRYAKASIAEDRGMVSAALRELKAVMDLRPGDPVAMNAYGYTLADNRKNLKLARRLIERAHGAAPANAAILDSLGWVLFRQGHDAEALPYLNAAYADDRDPDVAAHLGEVMWQLGRHADAERVWSEAAAAGGDSHLLKATRQRLGVN